MRERALVYLDGNATAIGECLGLMRGARLPHVQLNWSTPYAGSGRIARRREANPSLGQIFLLVRLGDVTKIRRIASAYTGLLSLVIENHDTLNSMMASARPYLRNRAKEWAKLHPPPYSTPSFHRRAARLTMMRANADGGFTVTVNRGTQP